MDTVDVSNRHLQQKYYYSSYESTEDDSLDDLKDLFNQLISDAPILTTKLFVEMSLYLIFAIAGQAAIIYAVGQIYVGRDPRFSECLRKGFSKWCTLFCASNLVSLSFHLGTILIVVCFLFLIFNGSSDEKMAFAIIFLVIASVMWSVFIIYVMVSMIILGPTIMIENLGSINGIKRAWSLAKNNRCYIYCTLFGLAIVYNVVSILINEIVSNIAGETATSSAWGIFVKTLPALIYLPLVFILQTVVYLNIRIKREDMNRGVLMNDLELLSLEADEVDDYDYSPLHQEDYLYKPRKRTPVSISVRNVIV